MTHLYAIGSPVENDHLAWLLVDDIQPYLSSEYPRLEIEYFDRPGMQLVNEISSKSCVILVDTLLMDEPRDIELLQPDDLQNQSHYCSSHGFGVAEALQIAQHLKLQPEQLWILGIPVSPHSVMDEISIHHLSAQLLQNIRNIMQQSKDTAN